MRLRSIKVLSTEYLVRSASLVGLLSILCGSKVAAQQERGQPAVTNVAEAGPDFLLQGEYVGWITRPGRGTEQVGLQVVARGGGRFDAVRYHGGLPGEGWDRLLKSHFSGETKDGIVTLAGPSDKFLVAAGIATALDDANRELGRLRRVERLSPTLGAPPPTGAIVLFDGNSTDQFDGAKVTPDGLLQPGVLTRTPVGGFHLHLEFRTPYMPASRGQARGNSGVYIQRRYEVQILDSFGLEGAENECGGLYRQSRPDVNMCLPPLAWQTYDIWFTPPRFAADRQTKIANARITVLHNGVPIHWHREITAKTGGGRQEGYEPLPIQLQDHRNPVTFRNIWIVPGEDDYYARPATYRVTYRTASYSQGRVRPVYYSCR